ncbi:type 2 lanthipeptide synthetase LanM family protein [Geitlerinema splendidum]|nr:type 2 lanthipeptide synthetase LanM family protein [Geitlerinema splendidum]
MDLSVFQGFKGERALTLSERSLALSQEKGSSALPMNAEFSDRRRQRWQTEFRGNAAFFQQHLAQIGITESQFYYLLGEFPENLRNRHPELLAWETQIQTAFAQFPPQSQESGFFSAIAPLIEQGKTRLSQQLSALAAQHSTAVPFEIESLERLLLPALSERLQEIFNPTFVLELNVARLQGRLSGDTPSDRFQSFVQHLQDPEFCLSLLQEYPVLVRQCAIAIDCWVEGSQELLQRLGTDWDLICAQLSPQTEPGVLVQIHPGAGDRHHRGRSVTLLQFSSGFRLVYKPKPLAVDLHFQELLAWINQNSDFLPFSCWQGIDRGEYGWMEFIAPQTCQTPAEIERFYQRLGGYLALLYLLAGTDFHAENLIAVGEQPILIDLESLFQPYPDAPEDLNTVLPARRQIAQSVLRIGLLPRRLLLNRQHEAVDASGMGGDSQQLAADRIPHLAAIGTDTMRVVRQPGRLRETHNQPSLNDRPIQILNYREAIACGFSALYRFLLKSRDRLEPLLENFASDPIRIFLRETRTYSLLLRESFHPDVLRDALERDRLFNKLWVDVKNHPYLAQLIPAEREALWLGDIPKFTTRPNSRHLALNNAESLTHFFTQTGLELVQHRLQCFSEDDLQQQLQFIDSALTTLAMVAEVKTAPAYAIPKFSTVPDEASAIASYLQAACKIGDRLEGLAARDRQLAGWVAPVLTDARHWAVSPLGWDLFEGLPGIALFLAYLGEITQEQRYTTLAQAAIASLLYQIRSEDYLIASIGAFSGWGGLIYSLTHLGILWQQPHLLEQALAWVELLPERIAQDRQFDIMGGAAGCIGALVALGECVGDSNVRAAAIQCGDRLLQNAQTMPQGMGWITLPQCPPLSGFSHGAAGIAWALLKLATFSGEARFQEAAGAAIAYERSLFSIKAQNWLDLRHRGDSGTECANRAFGMGWSHGAPGIGLGRLHSLKLTDDPDLRVELDLALETTTQRGFGYNHCLGNGDLGNLEFLDSAQQQLSLPQGRSQVHQMAMGILASIQQQGWVCDLPLGVESLGLMTGLAGIGYGFLRLAKPDRVPSLLVLAPPPLR